MNTILEKIGGFDVLHIEGEHTWDQAVQLAKEAKGQHGIDDWVLPDRVTLSALGLLSEKSGDWHWSATPHVGNSNYAWLVYFNNGGVYNGYRYDGGQVRLVRASQCLAIGRAAQLKSLAEVGIYVGEQA
jgi:hypothetical protein